jgi:hypothetical protein
VNGWPVPAAQLHREGEDGVGSRRRLVVAARVEFECKQVLKTSFFTFIGSRVETTRRFQAMRGLHSTAVQPRTLFSWCSAMARFASPSNSNPRASSSEPARCWLSPDTQRYTLHLAFEKSKC